MASSTNTATLAERGAMIAKAKEIITSQERPVSPLSIAKQIGCDESTIQRWLAELGDTAREGVRCRKPAETRKANLIDAALLVAERDGFLAMTRKAIAEEAFVSLPLVNTYLGTVKHIRKTVMTLAVKYEILPILAEGIATGNPYAKAASSDLQARALASLTKG